MFEQTKLPGVVIITPLLFEDHRGAFSETYNLRTLAAAGIEDIFVQDNQSLSIQTGTIRGLHFQTPPHAQAKLVRVVRGSVIDIAVDIRRGSPAYGQWLAVELSEKNRRQLYIPVGFLHGFVTCEPDTEIVYKCTDYYASDCDRSVRFDDSDLGIDWGIAPEIAILSEKDNRAPRLRDIDNPFLWGGAQ